MIHYILKDALDSVETRRMKILRCLTEKRKKVDYSKLQEITCSNLKTIKRDIGYLNENFGDICFIKENENNQLELEMHSGDVRTLLLSFYHTTKSMQILNFISKKECTILKISNELYIAQSSCYKYLERVKQLLRKYNLELTRKNIKIIGSEVEIRKLFFLMEYVKNSKDIRNNLVDELIENIRFFGIEYSQVLKSELTIILDIIIGRTRLNKNVRVDDKIKANIREHYLYDDLYMTLSKLFLKRNINLPKDELDYLIIYLLTNTKVLIEGSEIDELEKVKKNTPLMYYMISDLINDLENNLTLSLSSNRKLFLFLVAFLKSRYISMKFIPDGYFFENLNEKKEKPMLVLNYLQKRDLNIINDTFCKWAEKNNFQYVESKDIESCWILLESCQLQEKRRDYNVLLCISKGPEWEYYAETMIKKGFGDNIHVFIYSDTDREYLNEIKLDFIITDKKINFELDANRVIIIEDMYNFNAVIDEIKIYI